ncbi:MAG: FeoA family protein [Actinobacteria bacterium 66_15]|nr:MAG: FeoA family protein [Actinobacteria bacterium 66_15]
MTPSSIMEPTIATSSLDTARTGQSFRVVGIDDADARIQALRFGMAEGADIHCVTRIPAGPIIIRSGRQEIAIGRALARRIRVTGGPVVTGQRYEQ